MSTTKIKTGEVPEVTSSGDIKTEVLETQEPVLSMTDDDIRSYLNQKEIATKGKTVYKSVLRKFHSHLNDIMLSGLDVSDITFDQLLESYIAKMGSSTATTKLHKSVIKDFNVYMEKYMKDAVSEIAEREAEPEIVVDDKELIVINETVTNEEPKPLEVIEGSMAKSMHTTLDIKEHDMKVMNFSVDHFIPKTTPRYVQEDREEFKYLDVCLEKGKPVLLIGEKGVGKSLGLASWACSRKLPFISFECAETVKSGDLLGKMIPVGHNEVIFKLGAIPLAIEIANKTGKACLNFEEISVLSQFTQKILNSILDWRKGVFVPDLNKTFRLNEGVKLLITASMNPSHYGGTNQLNEDLKSRFTKIIREYPTLEQEKKILDLKDIKEDLVNGMLSLAKDTRSSRISGEIDYALSPRDMSLFFEMYKSLQEAKFARPLETALKRCVLSNYEDPEQYKFVLQRIKSSLSEDLKL